MCAWLDRELTHHRGEITSSVINTIDHTHNIKVADQVFQSTELLGWKDPIDLQLPRAAAGSGNPQTSTTPATRFIDTKSFVASDSISWRQGKFLSWKWSSLIAVRAINKPLYEGFKKIEDNMSQDF